MSQCPGAKCCGVPAQGPSYLGGTEKRTRGGRRNAHFLLQTHGWTDTRTEVHIEVVPTKIFVFVFFLEPQKSIQNSYFGGEGNFYFRNPLYLGKSQPPEVAGYFVVDILSNIKQSGSYWTPCTTFDL